MTIIDAITAPIIGAPMAGGVSTPGLVAAVSGAGGLGYLAAGYLTADQVREQIRQTRELTDKPFGVNIFVPDQSTVDEQAVARYRERLATEARRYGVALGEPVADDDAWADKLDLVLAERVPAVSFTFGCPDREVIAELARHGTEVTVTVTSAAEATTAVRAGAHVLCVQGAEAGGHRGTFDNRVTPDDRGLLTVLREVRAAVPVPLVAAGGLGHGADIAAVLVAGARAAQLGTLLLACTESGAKPEHRAALTDPAYDRTAVTRAFTGRPARGLVNRFVADHSAAAPAAYPQVHHLTAPLRRAGGTDTMSLWAGQAHRFATEVPAAELVGTLTDQARSAVADAAERLAPRRE